MRRHPEGIRVLIRSKTTGEKRKEADHESSNLLSGIN